ncbi:DNA packaging protein [Hahella sp. KA22]|uniref:terminase small subunit n=1 Tax=unclassified Hahella TaxID=2624107 RepID=UPI000FDD4239|nr:terminase small subunit [Hahella sp. KA22]AZZ92757.1 DNA packaging protein [Hahella sp. KA22]MBU6954538.1 terminase small subunit [Hahella sp. HN01]QAY56131.1 DNA packaging protein [Hahella sp. KA22]
MKVNKKQLADIFGISERTFTQYQKDPDFPIVLDAGRGASNQYDTVAVFNFLKDRALSGAKFESARDRLDRIRAERETLALGRDLGELVPASELEALLEQVVTAIKTTLLDSNHILKTELDARYDIDVEPDILDEHSRQALTHLAALGEQYAESDSEVTAEVSASAEDDDEGLGE